MSRQVRFATLFSIVTLAAFTLAGIILLQITAASLRRAGATPEMIRAVHLDMVGALLAIGLVLGGVSVYFASLLAGMLQATRNTILARARGDDELAIEQTGIMELDELGSAAERLFARVHAREEALSRSTYDVTTLLDAISEGILQLDDEGRVVRANPTARALLGTAEPVGQQVATLIRHVELRTMLERAARGSDVPPGEIAHAEKRLLVTARPIRNVQPGGAIVSFIDLTEVRRLESVRRDFVANVSHELRTPITSIRGYAETLLADELPPETQRQFMEIVFRNAERMHRIIDDLLDLSRLESGVWRPEPQRVIVRDVVEDAWSGCSGVAQRRGIAFTAPPAALAVVADPGALRQVMSNLLENALRYTPDGGRIEVAACPLHAPGSRPLVALEVRDNGSGIPRDALPRIFERFYRVDPARSRAQGGTGLGLSIVKHLVESMGGDVAAESELGKGTVVRVRLPEAA